MNQWDTERLRKELLERTHLPLEVPPKLYIWGTGLLAQYAIERFQEVGICIRGILSSPGYYKDSRLKGIPVVPLENVDKSELIVLCSISYPAITDYLIANGYCNFFYYEVFPFLYKTIPAYYMWGDNLWEKMGKAHKELSHLSQMLRHDSLSLLVLNCLLLYRKTLDDKHLNQAFDISLQRGTQYFDSEILKFGENEVFVDCGASVGYISEEFIRLVHNKYKKIYLFEADPYISNESRKILENYHDIEYCPVGLGEKNEILHFHKGTMATYGTIANDGEQEVQVVRMDDYLIGVCPTMITMDIEGSEMEALKGAEKIIKRYRPKMGISVYHKYDDLYRIPLWLESLKLNYKFYLRHYSRAYCDTVLICIPQ